MSNLTDTILPILPYLRRHARLLTGSQDVGDEYVRLCLEMVVAEPHQLEGVDPRIGVFRAFHSAWSVVEAAVSDPDPDGGVGLERRVERGLAALAPLERRVLLLVVVEEFGLSDVAEILGLSEDEVGTLLQAAREDLNRQACTDVLIIEDEPMIAMELGQIVREMGHRVAAMANRRANAVEAAERERPGLVLADIQLLDDESGIDAAHEILERFDVPVVFVTGFPERLLTGDTLEPAFVVSKPFEPEALKVTMAQALAAYATPAEAKQHRALMLEKLGKITARTV